MTAFLSELFAILKRATAVVLSPVLHGCYLAMSTWSTCHNMYIVVAYKELDAPWPHYYVSGLSTSFEERKKQLLQQPCG
jgi:hypothetical protein